MKHTVKYWDKKLLSLQRLADSVGYDIDNDTDYLSICQLLPVSNSKPVTPRTERTSNYMPTR